MAATFQVLLPSLKWWLLIFLSKRGISPVTHISCLFCLSLGSFYIKNLVCIKRKPKVVCCSFCSYEVYHVSINLGWKDQMFGFLERDENSSLVGISNSISSQPLITTLIHHKPTCHNDPSVSISSSVVAEIRQGFVGWLLLFTVTVTQALKWSACIVWPSCRAHRFAACLLYLGSALQGSC